MNKSDLIQHLASRADLSRHDAQRVVDALFSVETGIVTDALRRGERIQLTGFGSFETRRREARMGRNPRTSAAIEIGPSVNAAFKPGASLKLSLSTDVHGPGGGGRTKASAESRRPGTLAPMGDTHGSGGGGRK
jgi:DNA-binding protein HU-beta